MSTISQRLRSLRKDLGKTQEEVSKVLGVTRSALAYWETGKNDPDSSSIRMLADYFGVTTDYLLGRTDIPDLPANVNAFPVDTNSMVKVPVIGRIAAGEPILAVENIIDYEYVQEDSVKNGEHFYLQVAGDSMVGARIHEGDLVLIRRQCDVDSGQIAAVIIEEEATLKRVYKENGHLILQSENPKYPPLFLSNRNDVKILGKVVKVEFNM